MLTSRTVLFSNRHLLLEEKDPGFNELLSDLLHDELLAALGFYADLAASSTAAVPCARAAWGKHNIFNYTVRAYSYKLFTFALYLHKHRYHG